MDEQLFKIIFDKRVKITPCISLKMKMYYSGDKFLRLQNFFGSNFYGTENSIIYLNRFVKIFGEETVQVLFNRERLFVLKFSRKYTMRILKKFGDCYRNIVSCIPSILLTDFYKKEDEKTFIKIVKFFKNDIISNKNYLNRLDEIMVFDKKVYVLILGCL